MTTTTNLAIEHVAESATRKDIMVNEGFDALDAALTEIHEPDLSGDSPSVSATEYRGCALIAVADVPSEGVNVALPAVRRWIMVANDQASAGAVSFVRGAASVEVAPGEGAVLFTDGSSNGLVVVASYSPGEAAAAFLDLSDTPSAYTGHGGKVLRVNSGATALEFVGRADVVASPVQAVSGTTHTPALTDAGTYNRCTNSGGCTVTIPTNTSIAFPIGTEIHYEQAAAGAVEIEAASGVSLRVPSAHDAVTAERYAIVTVKKVDADEWVLFGYLAEAAS